MPITVLKVKQIRLTHIAMSLSMEFVLNVHSVSISIITKSAPKFLVNAGISTPNQKNANNVTLDMLLIRTRNVNNKQRKQPIHFVLNGLMEYVSSVLKDHT